MAKSQDNTHDQCQLWRKQTNKPRAFARSPKISGLLKALEQSNKAKVSSEKREAVAV